MLKRLGQFQELVVQVTGRRLSEWNERPAHLAVPGDQGPPGKPKPKRGRPAKVVDQLPDPQSIAEDLPEMRIDVSEGEECKE